MSKNINRETIELDAAEQSVGRIAAKAAHILQGKNKPTYMKRRDMGDFVVIENASKVKFTGRKLAQKDYYHHTGHIGGTKRKPMKQQFEEDPTEVIAKAVNGMLPKNKHRDPRMKRLTIKE